MVLNNVEFVTREFLKKYRDLFIRTKLELDNVAQAFLPVKKEFELKNINTVDFAKKLLCQTIFLYFLQKKGWLGVERGKPWGGGPKDFIRRLFNKEFGDYQNFYNDILEPLFYAALRTDRTDADHYYSRFKCKLPFLNDRLFEPNYNWVDVDILISNELFSNTRKTKEGDVGDGILDVFDRYNFTVNEEEPLEKEVALDPELLAKIYEKLNAIRPDNFDEYIKVSKSGKGEETKFNKKYGVYYTPREIVRYMCKESLKNYLCGASIPAEEFIKLSDSTQEIELTSYIRENAKQIDKLLADIKVCDPAVGSGAFPIGMMHEIVKLRQLLSVYLEEQMKTYDLKRHCIENSLYGVDIDPGAIEICKLRFWLSLIVDEEDFYNIKPLPNLDYNVVCGNSLLGIKKDLFNQQAFTRLEELKHQYFNETNPIKKQQLKQEIDKLIYEITKGHKEFDFEVYFSEVFHQKGGFDILIANPPYIQLQKAFDQKMKYADIYKDQNFETFERTGDIYCLFYEKGIQLLKENGSLCYITSNKWMRAGYGESLRKFFLKFNPKILIDLGPNVFENATVDTNILLIGKAPNQNILKAVTIKETKKYGIDFNFILRKRAVTLSKLTKDAWFIGSDAEQKLKEKIERIGKPLKDWDVKIYRGVLTGLNEAFIISTEKRNEILANCKTEEERKRTEAIIKPILRGRDIKRYHYQWAGLWLINTHNGYYSPLKEGCQTKSNGVLNTYKSLPYNPALKQRAKELRKAGNLSEVLLWNEIKNKKLLSLDFHRQKIIGNYIVDFYCPELDLVIEIDGSSHDFKGEHDAVREEYLKSLGLNVIHFEDRQIKKELKWILGNLYRYCEDLLKKKNTPSADADTPLKEGNEWIAPINIDDYPAIKRNLDKFYERLVKRQDQGNTPYNLRDCAYYPEFEKEKVVWGDISYNSEFCFVGSGIYINAPANFITTKITSIKYLIGNMNSKIFDWQFKQIGIFLGHAFAWKKQYIEQVKVPSITPSNQHIVAQMEALVDKIITAKKQNPQTDTTQWEKEIDQLVYQLYGLTEEEIKIVESQK